MIESHQILAYARHPRKERALSVCTDPGPDSPILKLMTSGHGYKARYDYVELLVERREDHWRLILMDLRRGERVEHGETFETPAKAQDAALTLAQDHIYRQHNDTLMARNTLSWTEF